MGQLDDRQYHLQPQWHCDAASLHNASIGCHPLLGLEHPAWVWGFQFAFPRADEAVHHELLYYMGNLYALLSFLPKQFLSVVFY